MKKKYWLFLVLILADVLIGTKVYGVISANKTWQSSEVLTASDLNAEYTHNRAYIKENRDLILGDSAEGTGYSGHDHEGTNGVQLGTSALNDTIVTLAKLSSAVQSNIYKQDQRAMFNYSDSDTITIDGGCYYHDGTTDQYVYWNSLLTYDFSSLNASQWHYLYIDDSAVVTAGTNLLTASEFIDSNTPPTWSHSKRGWYNGEDVCIFAVLTDGSSNIKVFSHNGNSVFLSGGIEDYAANPADSSYVDVTLSIPSFARKAIVTFRYDYSNKSAGLYWRKNGESGSGYGVCYVTSNIPYSYNTANAITDSNKKIEITDDATSTNVVHVYTNGFYLPTGM